MKTALALLLASALIAGVFGKSSEEECISQLPLPGREGPGYLTAGPWCWLRGTDNSVLRNVYSVNAGMNPSLRRDSRLEILAKSHGCVSDHSQHQGSWQDEEILNKYFNIGSNIACASHLNDRNAQGWRSSPGHLENIRDNNRVGCSAPTNCDCTFCYYANA